MLTAWGDESGSQPHRDPGTYLIAAALCEEEDVPALRKVLNGLRLPREKKVHWHASSTDRRRQLAEAIAASPVAGFVVVHTAVGASDRRQRRKCLEYLLPNLADIRCGTIIFESRGGQDRSDIDLVQKLRARKAIDSALRIGHAVGPAEPALWAADIICGAVVQARVGNHEYLELIARAVDVHLI